MENVLLFILTVEEQLYASVPLKSVYYISSLISNLTQVSEVASAEVFHPEMPIEVQVFRPTSICIILMTVRLKSLRDSWLTC